MRKTRKRGEKTARISLQRCGGYDSEKVFKAVKKAIDDLGGIDRFVKKGDRVLLKPNLLVSSRVDKHVTTHPEVVRATLKLVKKAGGKPSIGDSPALGSAVKVAAKCGIADVAREEGVEVINFNRPIDIDNPAGAQFKKFKIDEAIRDADVVINLPKLKTHGQMTLTMSVKNMFGSIPGTRKTQWHLSAGTDRMHFARMLVDLCHKVSPQVTIMDAIVGMQGNGPQNGDAKKIGLVMAAEDPVALDVVASEIVGLRRDKMLTTVAAEEMGIGCTDPEDMSIGGESVEDCKIGGFVFPMVVDIMSLFPWFLRNPLRDWLTSRPVVDRQKCELCMVCANSCPARVITAKNDKLQFDLKQCIRCFCCQEMCPQGAITVGAGPLAKALRL